MDCPLKSSGVLLRSLGAGRQALAGSEVGGPQPLWHGGSPECSGWAVGFRRDTLPNVVQSLPFQEVSWHSFGVALMGATRGDFLQGSGSQKESPGQARSEQPCAGAAGRRGWGGKAGVPRGGSSSVEALLPEQARTVTLPRPGSGELGCVWSGTCSHDCLHVVSPCGEVRGLHKVNLWIRVWARGPALPLVCSCHTGLSMLLPCCPQRAGGDGVGARIPLRDEPLRSGGARGARANR